MVATGKSYCYFSSSRRGCQRAGSFRRLARLRRQHRQHALLDARPDHAGERRRGCRSRGRTRRATSSRARRCRRTRSSSTACCTRRSPKLRVFALDAATGASCGASTRAADGRSTGRFRHRGVVVTGDRVLFNYRNRLWALDRKTGQADPHVRRQRLASICAKGSGGRSQASRSARARPASCSRICSSWAARCPRALPSTPGRHPRLRCQHGRAAMDLSHDPAARRVRLRHMAARGVQGLRRRERVVGRDARSATRHRVRRDGLGVVRFLRREPTSATTCSRTRVLALDARTGQARLALPGHQARSVGLGFPRAAGAGDRHARRHAGRRGRADHEDGLRLRLRARRTGDAALPDRVSRACRRRRSTARRAAETQPYPDAAAAVRAADISPRTC